MSGEYIRAEDLKRALYEIPISPKAKDKIFSIPTYTPAEITARQWVPVSERLPENDNSVLGWSAPLGDLTITERDDFASDCITHWFPFPELPKEEGKK